MAVPLPAAHRIRRKDVETAGTVPFPVPICRLLNLSGAAAVVTGYAGG
jgi:hypothetical protein